MPSQMMHSFALAPQANIQRSVFARNHTHKSTFPGGYIIPFYADEVLPGDTFVLDATLFIRMLSPLSVPIMDNIYVETFYFFTPNRLVWENWQKFCGERTPTPDSSIDYTVPQIVSDGVDGWQQGELSDYLGLPIDVASLSVCAFWHRAYNLIYNEWFRDQNLQSIRPVDIDDGPDTTTDYYLNKRGKRHDYFTSCLPTPQKGDDVMLPLGSQAPVEGIGKLNQTYSTSSQAVYETPDGNPTYATCAYINPGYVNETWFIEEISGGGYPAIFANLSDAEGAAINEIREAFQIQKMLERDARCGTRYREILKGHFGVDSPDQRLQRPEFLGGERHSLMVNPVPQTSETDTTEQGTLAAYVVGSSRNGFTKSFVEHGTLLGLLCVYADLTYQEGLPRMFSRLDRYDFYWPSLAHLGEQAVLNKEIFCDNSANDDDVFGYQERWAEYRYKNSQISGSFRSQATNSLDVWHLAQEFASLPTLNATFISETPPFSRVMAVESPVDEFLLDSFIRLKCVRPMPVFSVPGMLDHF